MKKPNAPGLWWTTENQVAQVVRRDQQLVVVGVVEPIGCRVNLQAGGLPVDAFGDSWDGPCLRPAADEREALAALKIELQKMKQRLDEVSDPAPSRRALLPTCGVPWTAAQRADEGDLEAGDVARALFAFCRARELESIVHKAIDTGEATLGRVTADGFPHPDTADFVEHVRALRWLAAALQAALDEPF